MKNFLLNSIAVIIGLIVGSCVNMFLINLGSSLIPSPNGSDVTTQEGLKATIHLFTPKHYIFPFLAHAIGTFIGAFFTALIAKTYQKTFALIIGIIFLIGGISMIIMLPSPLWFNLTDIIFAYIPFAFLGYKTVLLIKNKKKI